MRIIVCGGRDYSDQNAVFAALDRFHKSHLITCIINGGTKGADELAQRWARERRIECRTFPAKWSDHGRAAGPIRNREMLVSGSPDGVIAFPGGRGTADMKAAAKQAGVRVFVPDPD